MKNTVIIEPNLKAYSDMICPTSYNIGNRYRYLIDEETFVELDFATLEAQKYNPAKLRPFMFGKNMAQKIYTYNTEVRDGKTVPATEKDREIHRTIEIFWKEHPLTLENGKVHKNTKSPLYNVIDQTKKDVESISNFDKRFDVASAIKAMPYETKCDVAYFYGLSPVFPERLTDGQLLIKLADFSHGLCMNDTNIQSFIKTWIDGDKNREYRINARKAIEQSLIVNMPKDGRDNYYHGQTFIGINLEDIEVYFKKDQRLYDDHILRMLKDTSTEMASENKAMDNMVSGTMAQDFTPSEIQALRDKAKSLKKEGLLAPMYPHHQRKPADLVRDIKEAEKKRAVTAE